MGFLQACLLSFCAGISAVLAIPTIRTTTVMLDNGTFIGTTSNGLNKFLGIPFAHPPCVTTSRCPNPPFSTNPPHISPTHSVLGLRFRLPEELGPYNGSYNASTFGPACPQQALLPNFPMALPQEVANHVLNVTFARATQDGEDCV